jgi:hypothetical protein
LFLGALVGSLSPSTRHDTLAESRYARNCASSSRCVSAVSARLQTGMLSPSRRGQRKCDNLPRLRLPTASVMLPRHLRENREQFGAGYIPLNSVRNLAHPTRFELVTSAFGGRRLAKLDGEQVFGSRPQSRKLKGTGRCEVAMQIFCTDGRIMDRPSPVVSWLRWIA